MIVIKDQETDTKQTRRYQALINGIILFTTMHRKEYNLEHPQGCSAV
jgi:hypothetical protein